MCIVINTLLYENGRLHSIKYIDEVATLDQCQRQLQIAAYKPQGYAELMATLMRYL
jgi:hypothetical protein